MDEQHVATAQGQQEPERLFAEMDGRHRGPLYRWAIRHRCSPCEAGDLLQDAFERALRTRPALSDHSSLRAWLLVVLRHLLTDERRRAENRYRVDLDLDRHSAPVSEAIPFWRRTEVDPIADLLPLLSPVQREVLQLQVSGCSIDAIAGRLGLHPSTVGTRLFRARLRMREIVMERLGIIEAGDEQRPGKNCARAVSPRGTRLPKRRVIEKTNNHGDCL